MQTYRKNSWLQRILAPPVFPGDEQRTELAGVLYLYVVALTLLLVIALPIILIFFEQKLPSLLAWAATILVMIGGRVAVRQGYVRQVAFLSLAVFWLITTGLVYISGGMQSLDWAFYLPGMVAAGLFFELTGALAYGLLSLAAGLLMVILDSNGYPQPRLFPFLPMTGWILLLFTLAMTILPLGIYLQRLRSALAQSRQELAERKLAQDEIGRLNAELEQRVQQRTAELQAANKEMELYSYSVSHDLRAPIRSVVSLTQLVIETCAGQLPEDAQRDLRHVIRSGLHMSRLVDDLLELLWVRRKPLARSRVDMTELAREVWTGLCSEVDGDPPASLSLEALPACQADLELASMLWLRILDNAVKFTRSRSDPAISVGSQPSPAGPVYFVRDNGIGFNMRYAERIFDVFQRLNRAEDYTGTGAGLAIARRIVERHGGRIWVEAAVDEGATFYFTLER